MSQDHVGFRRVVTASRFFTLTFGGIVGVAWIVLLGDFVGRAGPLGSALALLVGAAAIGIVALCYVDVANQIPAAGGEIVITHATGSLRMTFAVGWILCMTYVSVCIFEAISLAWIIDMLFPEARGRTLYVAFGEPVTTGGLTWGIVATLVLGAVNVFSARASATAQEWVTYCRIAVAVMFLWAVVVWGRADNLEPLFAPGNAGFSTGIVAVLATAPFLYAGFNIFASVMEERSANCTPGALRRAILLAVFSASVFYIAVIAAMSSIAPWQSMVKLEMPAATVLGAATGIPVLTKIVLGIAAVGNFTAWNGVLLAASRSLVALARARLIDQRFEGLSRRGTPLFALQFITLVTLLGLPFGRGFIMPAVNLSSACFAAVYLIVCLAAYRLRKRQGRSVGVAVLGMGLSAVMLMIALLQPALASSGFAAEWIVLLLWTVVGCVFWWAGTERRNSMDEEERGRRLRGMRGADDPVEKQAGRAHALSC